MEQMSRVRRSDDFRSASRRPTNTMEGRMPLTQLELEHAGTMEAVEREEDAVVAKEAEVAGEDVDPQMMTREAWSRSPSLSPSPREEPIKSRTREHHRHHPHQTWQT
jgi:hypothetical protein